MNLLDAFRLNSASCVAFVGAGGKTTALFELSRLLSPPVLVTTTTHFASYQIQLADHHYGIEDLEDFNNLKDLLREGVILLTGTNVEGDRVGGLDNPALEGVRAFAKHKSISLLIEADGARGLPLKAPAEHEPAIPPFVEVVIVVAGLSGLGKPLGGQWVHRVEQFASLSGLTFGEIITPQALSRVLVHPLGGLKYIPVEARRLALLTQADTTTLQSQAFSLSRNLLPTFDTVILATLNTSLTGGLNDMKTSESDHNHQRLTSIFAVYEPVAGIVLAGGSSTRFGRPKLTLPWRGEPMVRQVVLRAIQAGLSPVLVVTGNNSDQVFEAIKGLPISAIHNVEWKSGLSTSVIAGVNALPSKSGSAVFLLADQPQIPVNVIKSLVEKHAQTLASIVAPQIDGQRGNPVLFDRRTFEDLRLLKGDSGGRTLFSMYKVEWVPWHDSSLLLDVDTPEDYQHLLDLDD
jgi:molybdenum cofactor cytidylyltransferase